MEPPQLNLKDKLCTIQVSIPVLFFDQLRACIPPEHDDDEECFRRAVIEILALRPKSFDYIRQRTSDIRTLQKKFEKEKAAQSKATNRTEPTT
jgi:hypothetical protein